MYKNKTNKIKLTLNFKKRNKVKKKELRLIKLCIKTKQIKWFT
jgi:hypothetical protein